ncbi:MAG: short-chain dehydrogenase/reductase [Ilumatobacteraceae bacterium]|nr:short-chain dehydrogenase/reductase [Ilumatobacteraceae bacterium]
MGRLDGKIALITGGGKGIGRGTARLFTREGATVVIAEIDDEAGEETAAGLAELGHPGIFVHCDVSDREQMTGAVTSTIQRFGRLDVLVNDAIALTANVPVEEKTDDMLDTMLRRGFWHTWWSMQAAFPTMRDQGGGHIINFYSNDADRGAWTQSDYCITKAAILALTRSAATDWAQHGVYVNCIAPGAKGSVYEWLADQFPFLRAMGDVVIDNPLARSGVPEDDVAPVVLFLATMDSQYISGELIHAVGVGRGRMAQSGVRPLPI